ncbi:YjfB family protein [Clostridium gasigenes]|uniref:YjfB family protein n=1 Tax=Clostridium gasigenes TaxID=94869 RepID=UPI001623712D|nr:YjfB family protein [Clostridium gasigenes]MBB6624222.1 YjfB family protein [Clostridium gasigenes]MBU3089323.1 YjfB family protein [Clostridium gasigenes]
MDIGRISMNMSQNNLKNAVSLSVMKLQMNTNSEMEVGMKQMMEIMAVDNSKGNIIDIKS